jgi:hypothetical protein
MKYVKEMLKGRSFFGFEKAMNRITDEVSKLKNIIVELG